MEGTGWHVKHNATGFCAVITFCYDRLATPTVGYPNLAQWPAKPYTPEWRQFDAHWPRTVPLRLTMYLDAAHVPYSVSTVAQAPKGSWYPIAFSWFDFTCDYFGMLSPEVVSRIAAGEIKILFYYHEGDNPQRIQEHLYHSQFGTLLPRTCYHFISANSAADQLTNATYFPDHEFFFRHVNRKQNAIDYGTGSRPYDFTLLNRTHKWWRASCVSDLLNRGLLARSQWSYHTDCSLNEDPADNPLELDTVLGWRQQVEAFVAGGPYLCDQLNLAEQNDHHWVNVELYNNSYFHIVAETHFDADQSGGTFITEKTYKAIKFGQPFVMIGPAGTLAALRRCGYRTFDHVLDNSYDTIEHNTERWHAVCALIESLHQQDLKQLFDQCRDDVAHNQEIFLQRQIPPLNTLLERLT